MIDLPSILKDTGAYKRVLGDKRNGSLSHAYLLLTADGDFLDEYLKIFAKLMLCDGDEPCGTCRKCRLIDENSFVDLIFYPKESDSITSEEVNALIEESYIKPIEGSEKVFVISHAEKMNIAAQNKLLKTLEEPPRGVHILLGATSEFPLLSTVKSRVKKLEIPPFTRQKLFDALIEDYPDDARLNKAIACGDGTVGKAVALYSDDKLKAVTDVVRDVLVNMKSSSEVVSYSAKVLAVSQDGGEFLSVLELALRDMLVERQGEKNLVFDKEQTLALKDAKNFSEGAIIYALDSVLEGYERKKFNANPTMLVEWLLFKILEGKYKWQKL